MKAHIKADVTIDLDHVTEDWSITNDFDKLAKQHGVTINEVSVELTP